MRHVRKVNIRSRASIVVAHLNDGRGLAGDRGMKISVRIVVDKATCQRVKVATAHGIRGRAKDR